MTDKHTLTLDHQVAQSRKVKALTAENARLRKALEEVRTRCADEVTKRDSGDWADTNVVSMGDIARKALRGAAVDDLPPAPAAKGQE